MTFTTIAIAAALIVFVLAKRVRGEAVREPKKLFLLPIVVGVIGLQNVTHAKLNTIDIAVIAAGSVLSLVLGLLRGKFDRVTLVNGSPFMSWSAASVAVFAGNVLAKLALDAGGVAAGGTTSALSSSILLSLGLTLLGEAAVVCLRSQSLSASWAGEHRTAPAAQASTVGPCSNPAGPPSGPRSGERGFGATSTYLYEGRYPGRCGCWRGSSSRDPFIGRPHPTLSGHGLVILISLIGRRPPS
jgi:hypothetical protein